MKFEKSPLESVDLFHKVVPSDAEGVTVRQMFGYPCAFCHGNMFMGLYESTMILRLSAKDRAELLHSDGVKVFEPMAGRPMKEYVAIPMSILTDKIKLSHWIDLSFRHIQSLPPKQPKPKK